jgi:cysteine synthase A
MCDAVEMATGWSGVTQCRKWKEAVGLGLGGSSGAVLAAALRHLATHDELTDIACLCPDLDDNYIDTIYSDRWVTDCWPGELGREQERVT